MAVGQSELIAGQKPIREITRSDFTSVDDSEPLRLLPPGFEHTPQAQQGIATYVKVFVPEVNKVDAALDSTRKIKSPLNSADKTDGTDPDNRAESFSFTLRRRFPSHTFLLRESMMRSIVFTC